MIAVRNLACSTSSRRLRHVLLQAQPQQELQYRLLHSTLTLPQPARRSRPPPKGKSGGSQKTTGSNGPKDAHQMADELIAASPDTRIPGTEAIASLTPEQRMRNYATAAGLVAFITGVWWYSMQAVGRGELLDEAGLRAEAEEAKDAAERRSMEEKEAEDLAELEVTMANLAQSGGGDLIEAEADITVAVAAPDGVAREEEERNLAARTRNGGGTGGRPLWKKILLFWQK
mmetsp:Transcript_34996/g.76550  ORF Transcript_34996/g.76550 Transcript_34996/m.76550 type:complete len:230 (+) Transcript_34996:119-808(+)